MVLHVIQLQFESNNYSCPSVLEWFDTGTIRVSTVIGLPITRDCYVYTRVQMDQYSSLASVQHQIWDDPGPDNPTNPA